VSSSKSMKAERGRIGEQSEARALGGTSLLRVHHLQHA
jgi:hypothetical protein